RGLRGSHRIVVAQGERPMPQTVNIQRASSFQREAQAKTDVDGIRPIRQYPAAPLCRPAVFRLLGKGAATHDTGFSRSWPMRVNNFLVRVIPDPILAPLPDVAVHVVQAPRIRRETAYRRGPGSVHALLPLAVDKVPVVIRLVRRNRLATIKGCCRPGTASILPLRFGGQ